MVHTWIGRTARYTYRLLFEADVTSAIHSAHLPLMTQASDEIVRGVIFCPLPAARLDTMYVCLGMPDRRQAKWADFSCFM